MTGILKIVCELKNGSIAIAFTKLALIAGEAVVDWRPNEAAFRRFIEAVAEAFPACIVKGVRWDRSRVRERSAEYRELPKCLQASRSCHCRHF